MADWVRVAVELDEGEVDAVSGQLWAAGVAGIEEQAVRPGVIRLVAGLGSERLAAVEESMSGRNLAIERVEEDAGLDGWRVHAQPVQVGRVRVVPEWVEADEVAADVVLRLDAGRSFGHGGHVTTRLALDLLQRTLRPGDRVLDVGSGSGVLAIAAGLLGAGVAVAVDITREAFEAARHNVDLNAVGEVVSVVHGGIDAAPDGAFDLVVANIEAPILVDLADQIMSRLTSSGVVVLSGFIEVQEPRVRTAFAPLASVDRVVEDDWVGLVLQAGRAGADQP